MCILITDASRWRVESNQSLDVREKKGRLCFVRSPARAFCLQGFVPRGHLVQRNRDNAFDEKRPDPTRPDLSKINFEGAMLLLLLLLLCWRTTLYPAPREKPSLDQSWSASVLECKKAHALAGWAMTNAWRAVDQSFLSHS